ncbi:MAG: hypothetical protein WCL18_08795 [bacterium]
MEKTYEEAKYLATVFWINTFGLIFEIIAIILKNKKVTNPVARQANSEMLKQNILKLALFAAICLLICLVVHGFFIVFVDGSGNTQGNHR